MAVEPCDDPFGYLRNKMAADELINEQIEHTLMFENVQNSAGLSKDECRNLTLQAEELLKSKKVRFGAFDEMNFQTSFKIYVDQ